MTEDKETLREAEYFRQQVAVDIAIALYNKAGIALTDEQSEIAADAGIASMFERLQTPSETVLDAGWSGFETAVRKKKPWHEVMASTLGGALTAFQQENSDGR